MADSLLLSRYGLDTFLTCRRRFQLRYLDQLAWPAAPDDPAQQLARRRGERFHRLLERHFLGLEDSAGRGPTESASDDPELNLWWETYRRSGPRLPPGRRFAEFTLTVPLGRHFLTGRFDLLVVGKEGAHVFDWKTEREPRLRAALEADTQTRVYLALVAEGGPALNPTGAPIDAELVRLTYWYVRRPEAAVTLTYSRQAHEANREWLVRQLDALAAQVDVASPIWPLTEDHEACARCQFRLLCGRPHVPAREAVDELERDDVEPPDWLLAPEL